MKTVILGILICLISGFFLEAKSQCTALRQQRNITFNTNGDCAPVDITDYTITYFFNTLQNPADIVIHFEWNDPANSFDEFTVGDPGFVVGGGNTEFTATGTFSYPEDENCLFEPVAYVIVAGIDCETSEQTQLVSSWARDNNFGGNLAINPGTYNVCFGTAVSGAMFIDNSEFNCNINIEPDNPNRQDRHTQFVYGTNHNAGNSILDLSLVDEGGVEQDLTDNAGNLAATSTVGGITAAYFGDIVQIPFPADVPDMESLVMSAPSNTANVVGDQFEITLYNWNVCNPYNNDPSNPNYIDAVQIQAYIIIVEEPNPDFQTRLDNASGPLRTVFCLSEDIYFENLTPGGFNYQWEFFDDNLGVNRLDVSGNTNPVFSYNTSGDKLIRLTAANTTVPGTCEVVYEALVTISPDAIAAIGIYDATFSSTIGTDFCQDLTNSQSFEIGFRDMTSNVESATQWRWEFYDAEGDLMESLPIGLGNFSSTSITDFTRSYTTPGSYLTRLIAQNKTTLCETTDDVEVNVYPAPIPSFNVDAVCAGAPSLLAEIADSVLSLSPRIENDKILFYDWDFSYDGLIFNQELRRTNDDDFSWMLDGNDVVAETEPLFSIAGSYTVALRLTTQNASCTEIVSQSVLVNPLPQAQMLSNYIEPLCPGEVIVFTNTSGNAGPVTYELIVRRLLDNDLDTVSFVGLDLNYTFLNPFTTAVDYELVLRSINEFDCEQSSLPVTINVQPSFGSGFSDITYDPLGNNCSLWNSTFQVDNATRTLDADQYIWTIQDPDGIVDGYPVTRMRGDSDFHSLDYSITNVSDRNQVYLATLEVVKVGICVDNAQFSFQINPQPSALFSLEESDSCSFKIFRFEALQKGLVSYDWSFNPMPDEIVKQNDIQFIRYERPSLGAADLMSNTALQTTNLANCLSTTVTESVTTAAALENIEIDFSLSDDTLQLPDNEIFIQNNSTRNDTWSYEWDFGDGQTSLDFAPSSHVYGTFGIYDIRLRISNEFCERSLRKTLIVLPTVPIIDFEADVLEGCRPLTVNFNNLSQFAVSGTFVWEFGDGTTSNQDNPTYTYFRSGVYSVRLSGSNELGTTGGRTKQFYIEVFEVPIANFAINPQVVFIPNQKTFFSNLSSGATSYEWRFGDGNTSFDFSPSHTYENEGEYDISLIAINDFGCADTLMASAGVEAIKGGQIRSPNAFTPSLSGPSGGSIGGSGSFNDVFMPVTEGVTDFRMLIFNKWGQLLFESNDQQVGWDGYYKGKLMPMDVYVYRLELSFSDGRTEVKLGDVTLVR